MILRLLCLLAAGIPLPGPTSAASPEAERPILFGGDANYFPFERQGPHGPEGFTVDLLGEIAREGGRHAEHRLTDWPTAVRALEAGELDALVMFVSDRRRERFIFTPPIYSVHHRLFSLPGVEPAKTLAELRGKRVAVEQLSYAHEQLLGEQFELELVLEPDTRKALWAVAEGRADYALLAYPPAAALIRQDRLNVVSFGPPIWPREYAIAVHADRPELAQWLTDGLYAAFRSGAYADIYARWADRLEPDGRSRISRALPALAMLLLVLLMSIAFWTLRLRRRAQHGTVRLARETERRAAAEAQALWLADHAAETELPRLHRFSEDVEHILAALDPQRDRPMEVVALKLADLDRMICALGHEAARERLRRVAARLRAEEFLACGQTGRDVLLAFGSRDRIRARFNTLCTPDPNDGLIAEDWPRVAIGTATWPTDGQRLPELLRRAEIALSTAVEQRLSCVEYRPAMEPDPAALTIISAFHEMDGQGIYPVFQPQVDLRTGEIIGAEALARWTLPGLGAVPPDRFIPLLEDAGLIEGVTRRILDSAVHLAVRLREAGLTCPISVNVTARDLLIRGFPDRLSSLLRQAGGHAGDLRLELTETTLARDPAMLLRSLTRLRRMGIHAAIDDFGTGYSSMSYLQSYPVDELKIDRSFVAGLAGDPRKQSIVRAMIALAHELELVVVAEGVEREEDLHVVREAGCDRAQGYLFSKPLPEAELITLLSA